MSHLCHSCHGHCCCLLQSFCFPLWPWLRWEETAVSLEGSGLADQSHLLKEKANSVRMLSSWKVLEGFLQLFFSNLTTKKIKRNYNQCKVLQPKKFSQTEGNLPWDMDQIHLYLGNPVGTQLNCSEGRWDPRSSFHCTLLLRQMFSLPPVASWHLQNIGVKFYPELYVWHTNKKKTTFAR